MAETLTLQARAVEAYNAFCERVKMLNRVGSRLEVLSLQQLLQSQGQSRFRTLTSYAVTRIDDAARLYLSELVRCFMAAGARALAGEPGEHVTLVYMRGQASVNYLTINLAHDVFYLPLSSVLGEASIVLMCTLQLLALAGGGE